MSQQGAALQNYNTELVKCKALLLIDYLIGFEDLCKRREDIQKQIHSDEVEKAKLQRELSQVTEKLNKVNDSLEKKLVLRNELDRTIAESEAAYMKASWSIHSQLNFADS